MANNKGMILGSLIYWGFQKGTGDIAALFPSGDMRTRIQAVRLALFGLVFVALLYYRPDGLLGRRTATTEDEDG
jgi:ABC-type branched-subunit amino acid transport system permease subunit